MLLFILSAGFALGLSWYASGRVAAASDTRAWLTLAGVALQNSFICQLLSVSGMLGPGQWLALQCLLGIVVITLARRITPPLRFPHPSAPEPPRLRPLVWTLWIMTLLALGSSLWRIVTRPVWGFDETMYHVARVMLAIQEHTIFLAPTHNERQTVFPWGSEMWMLWPMLFTRAEWTARLLFWTAYPLTCWGVRSVLVRLGADRPARAVGVALWALTPLVFRHGLMQKPDLWAALWFLAILWGVARAVSPAGLSCSAVQKRFWAFVGFSTALALHTRTTVLPVLPGLAAVVLFSPAATLADRFRKLGAFFAACALGLLVTGAVLHAALNQVQHGGLFASPDYQRKLRSKMSLHASAVHLGRMQFDMLDFPILPVGNTYIEQIGLSAGRALGLAQILPGETETWPGQFEVVVPRRAIRLGLGGLLWTPLLAASLYFSLSRRRRDPHLAAQIGGIAWTSGTVAAAVGMTLLRSMSRYILSPYAAVPVLAAVLLARKAAWLSVLGLLILLQGGVLLAGDILANKWPPVEPRVVWDEISAVNRALPPDARILLAGSQDCPDYMLFGRETGYRRVVVPWGERPVRRGDLARLLVSRNIDTVVVENRQTLRRDWLPDKDPRPLIRALTDMGWRPFLDAGTTHALVLRRDGNP